MIPTHLQQRGLTVTTSGVLVAHAGLDAGPWDGSRPWGGVRCGGAMGQEELTWLLGQLATTATASLSRPVLPWLCCGLGGDGGNKGASCPRKEQRQKLGLWQGLRGLLWLCREGSHRPLSISLCLAPSWGRDYKSP